MSLIMIAWKPVIIAVACIMVCGDWLQKFRKQLPFPAQVGSLLFTTMCRMWNKLLQLCSVSDFSLAQYQHSLCSFHSRYYSGTLSIEKHTKRFVNNCMKRD